jgi:hypothetical protein
LKDYVFRTSTSGGSEINISGDEGTHPEPIASSKEIGISEKEIDLKILAGLDPLTTVYIATELRFQLDKAFRLGKVSNMERKITEETISLLIEGTRNNSVVPW